MSRYLVDPERSSVTVITRPAIGRADGLDAVAVSGWVEMVDHLVTGGSVRVTVAGAPVPTVEVDLVGTQIEVRSEADGSPVVHGRVARPSGAFGLGGPPLLNPTLLLEWRLVLTSH